MIGWIKLPPGILTIATGENQISYASWPERYNARDMVRMAHRRYVREGGIP